MNESRRHTRLRTRWSAIGAAVAVTIGAGGLGVAQAAVSTGDRPVTVTIAPERILDTRTDLGLAGKISNTAPRDLQVTGLVDVASGGQKIVVPPEAVAVLVNVTVIRPNRPGFLSLRPGGATGLPTTSTVNFTDGSIEPNFATVDLDDGKIQIWLVDTISDAGSAHVAVDVVGYTIDHDHDDRYYTRAEVDGLTDSQCIGQTRLMQELSGRTAVITGAASGIGFAMAHRFGAAGMNLVLGDIESGPLDAATTELIDSGYDVSAMELDVSDLDGIRAFETFARESFGNVHLLCNNAGVGAGGPVADLDNLDLWKWTIDINLWGVIYGCKVFMGAMIEHGEGAHIVNTASMAGHLSAPMMGPYNISKYGVVALSETMAKEMAMMQTDLGVSVLCPAFVQTKIATSDRNLPAEIKAAHGREESDDSADPNANGTQSVIEQLIASGIPTVDVAEAVHDAVVKNEFWILTHPESRPAITDRARQIVDGINPPLTGFV